MPFPRFDKLPQEKRERLLEIAAEEFAKHGFEDGSVNRILERAKMSKGAAYYYFEDKIDLFFTVVQYGNERLKLINQEVDIAALTEENFWPIFADLHREPLLRSFEEPWLFAAIKAAGALSPAALEPEALATFSKQNITSVMAILKRGEYIGGVPAGI